MLFEPSGLFDGVPVEGFEVFRIPDRDERRRKIVSTFHPALEILGQDLIEHLEPRSDRQLYKHLPRLDWPPDYQPFCTWLALSHELQGYQAGAQLNVGIHAQYVAVRLGWDTQQDAFGRFEFRCRHGELGSEMAGLAAEHGLKFRIYASAGWPQGSRCVFESDADWRGAFEVSRQRGVWFEVGVRHELPGAAELIASPALGKDAARVFGALLPLYDRL